MNEHAAATSLTAKQVARRAEMFNRTMVRLNDLADAARASDFEVGRRTTQPPEVQSLQRRMRGVTMRWCPIWTTNAALAGDSATRVHLDHVVPVVVLVERVLGGDDVHSVIEQSVLCRLTYAEHREGGLQVAFRLKERDLYQSMLDCPLTELAALGWQRYSNGGIRAHPLQGWRNVNFHLNPS